MEKQAARVGDIWVIKNHPLWKGKVTKVTEDLIHVFWYETKNGPKKKENKYEHRDCDDGYFYTIRRNRPLILITRE